MFGYTLQDWTTIRSQDASTKIIQNESDWMGFSSFQDMVFWIDTREATIPSGGTISLALRTAPSKDEPLFQTMYTASFVAGSYVPGLVGAGASLPKVILAQGPSVPLATWVRWELSMAGGSGSWDLTFRVLLSANRVWR